MNFVDFGRRGCVFRGKVRPGRLGSLSRDAIRRALA